MSQYPEHDRLSAISEESRTIGEFLDNCGYTLCKVAKEPYLSEYHEFIPAGNIQDILAEYFVIDRDKIEEEKRQMLEELRELNS